MSEENSPMSPMMKQKWEAVSHMKQYKNQYLDGCIPVLQKLYTCESISDEEIEEAIPVLQFGVELCNIHPKFGLMKVELNNLVERLNSYRFHRQRGRLQDCNFLNG